MSFAQGSRSRLAIGIQSNFQTRATGNYLELPYVSHSLNLSKQEIESQTSTSDREVRDVRHGQKSAAGQITVELRYGDPATEALIRSVMFNTWASNEIQIGTARTFLSIEDGLLDIGKFRVFTGMEVNRMALAIRPNAISTLTFDLSGRDMTTANASIAGTVQAAATTPPMDSFSGGVYDQIPMSGQELAIITSLDITVENGLNLTSVVGDQASPFQEFGKGRVTGSAGMYYADNTFIDRFINETESPLLTQVADNLGNDYVFYLPRIKYSGADAPQQNDQSRMVTLPFRALRPSTGSILSALRIQK